MTRAPLVLVVDDSAPMRERMSALARGVGFRVVAAVDGQEGLARLQADAPDIVVTDLHMPRMDGREMIRRIRQDPRHADASVLAVTADATRAAKIEVLGDGADDFVLKPLDPDEFTARLLSLARRRQLAVALGAMTMERDDALRHLEERNRELEQLTLGLVAALERANTLNDSDTGNHIRRVASYASLLARVVGCGAGFCTELLRYAGLHDVGKVGIRDAILKKPGALTPEEFDEMKTHTVIGADMLRSAGLPSVAVNVALHHHERWVGDGYPHRLAGEAIPLEARIVAVVDVYDALVTRRCYKPAYSVEEARSTMERVAGSHLDPSLVAEFHHHADEVREIAETYCDVPEGSGWE